MPSPGGLTSKNLCESLTRSSPNPILLGFEKLHCLDDLRGRWLDTKVHTNTNGQGWGAQQGLSILVLSGVSRQHPSLQGGGQDLWNKEGLTTCYQPGEITGIPYGQVQGRKAGKIRVPETCLGEGVTDQEPRTKCVCGGGVTSQ